jgi:plasmid stabilization system protein ParE
VKLRYTDDARRGLIAQLEWLDARSPAAARRAADEVDRRLAGLVDFPLSAPAVDEHHRQVFIDFGRYGFVARYRIEGDTLLVVAILHGRQDR